MKAALRVLSRAWHYLSETDPTKATRRIPQRIRGERIARKQHSISWKQAKQNRDFVGVEQPAASAERSPKEQQNSRKSISSEHAIWIRRQIQILIDGHDSGHLDDLFIIIGNPLEMFATDLRATSAFRHCLATNWPSPTEAFSSRNSKTSDPDSDRPRKSEENG